VTQESSEEVQPQHLVAFAPEEVKQRAYDRYARDKQRREAALNTVYSNFVKGKTPARFVFNHVRNFIQMKADTQPNLRVLQRTGGLRDLDDHVAELLWEVWQKIEAKQITGPLSHWLNAAFKNHFIDAHDELSREWDAKRWLAEHRFELNMVPGGWEYGLNKPLKETTLDQETADRVNRRFAGPPKPIPAPSPTTDDPGIPIRTAESAIRSVMAESTEQERFIINVVYGDGLSQKKAAGLLNLSEPKVSRIINKIQKRIRDKAAELSAGTGQ
jgi:RNA polymerase sigma factor (sigma-70 family)